MWPSGLRCVSSTETRSADCSVLAVHTAVERVPVVVAGHLVLHTVEPEPTARDAVRVAADHRTEVGRVREVAVEAVVAEHDVGPATVAVRDAEGLDDRTPREHRDLQVIVAKHEPFHLGAVAGCAEDLLVDAQQASSSVLAWASLRVR